MSTAMPRRRLHATNADRQRAHREKQRAQDEAYAQLVLLQEAAAPEHVVAHGSLLQLQKHASAEQRALQQEGRERDFADVLWVLQTLIADFGYADVDRYVLQHVRRPSSPLPRAPVSRGPRRRASARGATAPRQLCTAPPRRA
jgi:hypothetical protein